MMCYNCGCKIKEFKDYWKNKDDVNFCSEVCLDSYETNKRICEGR